MDVIDIQQKFDLFDKQWTPHIIASLNGQHVKLAKLQGEFIWHDHAHEDELFIVIKGTLHIDLENETKEIQEGQMIVIPKGVKHRPHSDEECWVMLIEPASTKHTGDIESDRTVYEQTSI